MTFLSSIRTFQKTMILSGGTNADEVQFSSSVVSSSLHRAKCLCHRTFACAICLSADVSSGDTRECIGMPLGVVSGVGLGRGVLHFNVDRRRGRGSLVGEFAASHCKQLEISWIVV